jgi:alpha-tubulin suppressor-like RCC1 family protein
MYIYSNGNENYKEQKLQQFTSKNAQFFNLSFKGKTIIPKKTYIKKDCILCLTEEGDVYKKGLFNFEIQKDVLYDTKKVEKLDFPGYEKIKKIKFGTNHILFLSKNDYVFSLGSNYFGQLGISDVMIPETSKPRQIKYGNELLKCSKIHAYKDNSFAIDLNQQLYIWGKKDYLMNLYQKNLFRPTKVLVGYLIDDIYHTSGRMLVFAHKKNTGKDDDNNNVEVSSKISVVEKDEEGLDPVGFANIQEVVHALFQPFRVVAPDHAAQEYSHRVEAQFPGPSQLLVYLGVVVGVGAPHLYLVDGRRGDVVAT